MKVYIDTVTGIEVAIGNDYRVTMNCLEERATESTISAALAEVSPPLEKTNAFLGSIQRTFRMENGMAFDFYGIQLATYKRYSVYLTVGGKLILIRASSTIDTDTDFYGNVDITNVKHYYEYSHDHIDFGPLYDDHGFTPAFCSERRDAILRDRIADFADQESTLALCAQLNIPNTIHLD